MEAKVTPEKASKKTTQSRKAAQKQSGKASEPETQGKPAPQRASKQATARKAAAKPATGKAKKASKSAAKKPATQKAPTITEPMNEPTERRRRIEKRAPTLPVRADESAWSPSELEEVYRGLQAEADRLGDEINAAVTELADLIWDSGEGSGDDQADAGSKTFEREHEMSLAANARDMLAQTERAIKRIVDGTYGSCEGCGNPIGKARLQAYPRATLCVSCKQREERR